jgi:4-amino-4-deoxy-L-arabinose transferase-like glycosyltransferase
VIGWAATRIGRRVGPPSTRAQTVPASRWTPTGIGVAESAPKPARPTAFDLPTGLVAGLVFLGFFTTFRYGRPYLTNPPEVFWLSLPLLALLAAWPRSVESRLWWPLGLGLAIGLGLLAKSFALLAPVGAVLALWYLDHRRWQLGRALRLDTHKLVLLAAVALAVFGLWFALDPNPRAVWQEFVVGENVGKFGDRGHPLVTFISGPDSGLEYGAATFSNAGLLVGVMLAVMLLAWRERGQWSPDERRLWIWFGVFLLVFAIPSQRSARYLMPAMPALALLIALRWRELPAWSARVGHVLALVVLGVFAWLSLGLQEGALLGGHGVVPAATWAVYLLAATLALVGLAVTALNRTTLLAVVALVHLSIGWFLAPFEGRAGDYPPAVQAALRGQTVWVPCNFRARYEGHAFLLPGSQPRGYDERVAISVTQLAERYPRFAVRLPLADAAPVCEGCKAVGSRLDLRSRHRSDELRRMLAGDAANQLFVREWLVEVAPRASHAAHAAEAACR